MLAYKKNPGLAVTFTYHSTKNRPLLYNNGLEILLKGKLLLKMRNVRKFYKARNIGINIIFREDL